MNPNNSPNPAPLEPQNPTNVPPANLPIQPGVINNAGSPGSSAVPPNPTVFVSSQNNIPPSPVVSSDFSPIPAEVPNKPRRRLKVPLLITAIVIVILALGAGAYLLFAPKTKDTVVAADYIGAIQDKNKSRADALESPYMQAQTKKLDGATSFYSYCQKESTLCTSSFAKSVIAKSKVTYADYKSPSGTLGKAVTYTSTQTFTGQQAGGPGCSSTSTLTLTIDLIPHGRSWLIDDVSPLIQAGIDGSCLNSAVSGSSTAPSATPTAQTSTTSTTQTTPSSKSSPTSTPTQTSTTIEPTGDSIALADAKLTSVQTQLEAYHAMNNSYPSDLSLSNFTNQATSVFTPPPDIQYVYKPSPSGCTTAAQNCQSYVLYGADASGKMVTTEYNSLQ